VANEAQVDTCGSIKSYTALGDSFPAGFGSDQRLKTCPPGTYSEASATCTSKECGKDAGSYAYRFANELSIPSFQFLACTGNDTDSIITSQINGPDFGTPDLITINAGGDNENLFSDIIQACVFAFFGFDSKACASASEAGATKISRLPQRFQELFDALKTKTASQGTNPKVVVIGYAHYWGPKAIHENACAG